MNTRKKLLFLTLITLIAISALSIFARTANGADSAFNYQTIISATNPNVGDTSTYTFTIINKGAANLTSANVTIPIGYLNVRNLAITQQSPQQNWNISTDGTTIFTSTTSNGLTNGQSLTFTFEALNAQVASSYPWNTNALSSTAEALTIVTTYTLLIKSILPALAILGIAAGIAFLNSGVNRVLINYFIGWQQYRVMQKEMAEFRTEQMAAARANDKKQMEKLKKKQSQINSMQAKMMKPQMLQIGISFIYLIVWFLVLIPSFQNISMAYLPGFGPLTVAWLYPICSLFLGLISSRIIGIMPIDNQQ
jgi:uncharacterized membrane protein (DUF106 family)